MDIIDISDKFDKLKEDYEELFKDTEDLVEINHKKIKTALKDQIVIELNWELMAKKLSNLYDLCEVEVDSSYSDAIKNAMSDRYKEVTFTEAKVYAKADPSYKSAVRLMHDIRHIRDECKGILESVKSRKFILNNLSNLIVAGSENHII